MATNTTNYGFKKPDESDFYDVADQNKNWDLADEALKNLDTPTFEDYTGSTAVPSATDAIDQIKSKGKLGTLLSNIKAAFKGACLIGHIVNNCVTDRSDLPLSAAQGKALMDKYTQLYSDSNRRFLIDKEIYNSLTDLPSKGSCFGVIGNAPILINDSFSIPAYSRFAFINTGDSADGALVAIDANGNIYSAYRNNGIWNTGQVSASKSDLEKSGVCIGGIHIHSFVNRSSDATKKFTPMNDNSHMAGLLIVDQNNKTDVYSIGRLSGVQPLLKKSDADLPTISSGVLSVSLVAWGSVAFVSFDEFTIS